MDWFAYQDVVPKKAAAGILLTPEAVPRVLLGLRNTKLKFMGGHHVFPGGRVHDGDDPALVHGAESEAMARAIVTAAREIFEESGLLCSKRVRPDLDTLRDARRALLTEVRSFADILHAFHCTLEAADFIPAGAWTTPAFSPIRFDTQYFAFIYEGPPCEEVIEADGEIVKLEWMTAREARQRWHAGEIRLSTPVAYVLQHLEALSLADALPYLRRVQPELGLSVSRFELRRGVHILPVATRTLPPATHTNCVVIGERELYIVDRGPVEEHDRARLVDEFERLVAIGGRVAAVLLTHSHPDHTGAAELLRERFGAPIWAHAEAARQTPFAIDRTLDEGEIIAIAGKPGWRLRCLHTPGHDPGHLCFHEAGTRTMLLGDMAANPGTILISEEYGGNMNAYLASLERLLEEDFTLAVPGHGLPLIGNAGKEKIRELIAHRLQREAKIQTALDQGAQTLDALLDQAYNDTPNELRPWAEHQLKAHLARLGVRL